MWQAKEDFTRMLNEHQTTILVGETGSGKTTQICQFVAEAGETTVVLQSACFCLCLPAAVELCKSNLAGRCSANP